MKRAAPFESIRLSQALQCTLYLAVTLLLLSGLIWLLADWRANDPEQLWPAAGKAWSMKVHGSAVWITVFATGIIYNRHIRLSWQLKRNRRMGIGLASVLGWLALSGYLLYYVGGEELRHFASIGHWLAGLLLPLTLALHVALGRAGRPQKAG